jgi:hypothetical protein
MSEVRRMLPSGTQELGEGLDPQVVLAFFCDTVRTHNEFRNQLSAFDNAHPFHVPLSLCPNRHNSVAGLEVKLSKMQEELADMLLGRRIRAEVSGDTGGRRIGLVHDNWPSRGGRLVSDQIVEGEVASYCIHHGGILFSLSDGQKRHVQVTDETAQPLVLIGWAFPEI